MRISALCALLFILICANSQAADSDSPPLPPRRPSDCSLGIRTRNLSRDVKDLRSALETRYANEWSCNDKVSMANLRPDPRWGEQNVCSNFIKGKGKLGPWGQYAYSQMTPQRYPNLFRVPRDIAAICPNAKHWKAPELKKFYVWTLAETAYAESGCRAHPRLHRGPYGTLEGMFQMHRGHESVYSTFCDNGDASSPLRSVRCMIGMMDDSASEGNNLFTPRGVAHFATLRRGDRSGMRNCEAIRRYPGCGHGLTCQNAFGYKSHHRHRKNYGQ